MEKVIAFGRVLLKMLFLLEIAINLSFNLHGGPERDRTVDLLRAKQMLSQTELQAH